MHVVFGMVGIGKILVELWMNWQSMCVGMCYMLHQWCWIGMVLEGGPYRKDGVTMDSLRQAPHGIDLGPLEPCLPDRLFTHKKQIYLVPELMEKWIDKQGAQKETAEAKA